MKAGVTNLQLACSRLAALARCGRRCSGSGIFDRGRHEEEEFSSDTTDVAGRSKHDRYFSVRTCSDELSARLAHVFSRWDGLWHTLLFPKAETCIRHAACSQLLNLV